MKEEREIHRAFHTRPEVARAVAAWLAARLAAASPVTLSDRGFGLVRGEGGKEGFVHHGALEGTGFRALSHGERIGFDVVGEARPDRRERSRDERRPPSRGAGRAAAAPERARRSAAARAEPRPAAESKEEAPPAEPQGAGAAAAAGPEDEVKPAPEPVYLGGAAPRRVRPGDWFTAEFAAYVKAFEAQVAAALGRDYDPDEVQVGTPEQQPWPRDAQVTVRLTAPGLQVDEAEQSFTWRGTYCHVEFDVFVPEDAPERRTLLRFEAFIGAVRVGKVSLNLEVARAAAPGEGKVTAEAEGARKAFVSYAHKDQVEVLRAIGYLAPALRGTDFFVDLVSLRTGERWEPALEKAIRDCDEFLLFWSRNAKASDWVTREWTLALDPHGRDVLQLFLLERMDIKEVPERLRDFQFDSVWLRLAEQVSTGAKPA